MAGANFAAIYQCNLQPRAAQKVDQFRRIRRFGVAAPGNVPVGPHQHELFGVDRGCRCVVDVDTASGMPRDLAAATRPSTATLAVEPDQAVAVAERVVERAAVAQPEVRRAAARHRRRFELPIE